MSAMSKSEKRAGYLRQAWLVIVLALAYGAALAGVQTTLSGTIAENKRNETYHVIPELVPGGVETQTQELMVTGRDGEEHRVYKVFDAAGRHSGWVVPAGGQGFAGRIELLIGLDGPATTITGLYVLEQTETPGLGDQIGDAEFEGRFEGAPAGSRIAVVKREPQGENEVRAITGATISSESVSAIVNDALEVLRGSLAEGPGPAAGGGARASRATGGGGARLER